MPQLSPGEFSLVYNLLSLAVAAMLGSFVFFVLARGQLAPKFRPAMIMSSLVVVIAGYHYIRIFDNWSDAYALTEGVYVATGKPFNDAYRYVDWLLTVPLLVAELVAVLALPREQRGSLTARLVVAAALMVGLGYPGEISQHNGTRAFWAALSTVPFIYILVTLWGELSKATASKDPRTVELLRATKLVLLATWGFYPIAYMMPGLGFASSTALVGLQVGYSIADILAKCGYGVMIYLIARSQMDAEGLAAEPQLVPARAS